MTTTATAIATAVAIAKSLASGPYGYGQDDRWGHLASGTTLGLARLAARGDGDCSSTTGSIYYLAGIIPRSTIQGTWYTGNGPQKLKATGQFRLISVGGWSLARLKASLLPGDSVWGPGHVVFSVGGGQVLSFEKTEFGRSVGGKVGDQTGLEGRIRTIYDRTRSGGWAYIARPIVTGGATVAKPRPRFRSLTWNVLGARFSSEASWGDRCPDVIKTIEAQKPSIFAIVEAYGNEGKDLLQGLGSSWARVTSGVGVEIFYQPSKHELLGAWPHTFDTYHGYLTAELKHRASGVTYNYCSAHLLPRKTSSEEGRRKQFGQITDLMADWKDPTILVGDFNTESIPTWGKAAGYSVHPLPEGTCSGAKYDWAMVKNGGTLPRLQVIDHAGASDHDLVSFSVTL